MDFRQLMHEERARRQREQQQVAADTSSDSNSNNPPCAVAAATSDVDTELLSTPLRVWHDRSPLDLAPYAVAAVSGTFYVPDWITPDEELAILERVYAVPDANTAWVTLKRRRLQMWGGDVKAPFVALPLPAWLQQLVQALVDANVFTETQRPNHALINEYGIGDGILPHEDGPSYAPLVAIVSTGATSRVTFTPHRQWREDVDRVADAATHSFELARCSLLVFTGDAYTKYLHSIDNVESDKRVSMTIRHVRLK